MVDSSTLENPTNPTTPEGMDDIAKAEVSDVEVEQPIEEKTETEVSTEEVDKAREAVAEAAEEPVPVEQAPAEEEAQEETVSAEKKPGLVARFMQMFKK